LFTQIILLLILIFINAFFAASEVALISLNDNKVRAMAEDGDKKAIVLKKLLDEPSRFLATIQIGITLAGFLASAVAAESFSEHLVTAIQSMGINIPGLWLKTVSLIIITLILSYFTLVFGELVPKRIGMKKAEQISSLAVKPLNVISVLAGPFVRLLTVSTNFVMRLLGVNPDVEDYKVTEEEIRMLVDVGEEKGTIHESEKEMINNIFEFDNKTAEEIMTHRTEITALPLDADLEEVINTVNTEKYSRVPVYDDNIDNIVGILHARDLLQYISENNDKSQFKLSNIIRKAYLVPSSKRADLLFRDMQKSKIHMAVVIDEYGGTAGIVTIEDLVEEIVGNIFDEYDDVENEIEKLDDNTFIIDGLAPLRDVEIQLGLTFPDGDYETLSGFLISCLGRIPAKNERPEVELDGVVFKIEEMDDNRITRVKACKI